MGVLRQLWKNRDLLMQVLRLIQQAVKSATTLAQIKEAIKKGIDRGDLDDDLDRFAKANKRADEYVNTGR